MKHRSQLSFALLLSHALTLFACAATEPTTPNGQSHWLRQCTSMDECGELSCVCGVCTTLCANDAGCNELDHEGALCRSAEQLGTADACERGHAAVSMCVSSCERDRDCADVAAGLACETGLCVLAVTTDAGPSSDARASSEGDASSPPEPPATASPDGGEPEPLQDAGPAPPALLVDCEKLRTQSLPAGIEQVFSSEFGGELLAADEDAVYAGTAGRIWRVPVDVTSAEDLVQLGGAGAVQTLLADGGELFFGTGATSLADLPVMGKVTLADGSRVNLAREPTISNITSIFVARDLVYWLGEDHMNDSSVWRSDREPGTSVMLASAVGSNVSGSLQVVGDWLYFAVSPDPGGIQQLFRAPLDGSGSTQPVGEPVQGLNGLLTDGKTLFATLVGGQDALGNPSGERGVARVGLQDGAFELMYPTEQMGDLAMDATYLYWTERLVGGNVDSLWRGRLDGRGRAVKLVEGWQGTFDLAVSSSFIYWSAFCEDGGHVLRLSKSSLEP
jgi:hypothetical protein